MAGNTNEGRKGCSRTAFLSRILMKFFTVVALIVVSFLGGYLLNLIYQLNNQEIGTKINPIEQRSTRRSTSGVKAQLLNSLKAENLEENSR